MTPHQLKPQHEPWYITEVHYSWPTLTDIAAVHQFCTAGWSQLYTGSLWEMGGSRISQRHTAVTITVARLLQAHRKEEQQTTENVWHLYGGVRISCKQKINLYPSCLVSLVYAAGVGSFLGLLVPGEHHSLPEDCCCPLFYDHTLPIFWWLLPAE